jgi:Tfp pilus assembly protein PilF
LLLRLTPDGSDPLFLDERIDLPAHGCGVFSFTPVPAPYFDLMETAADESLALPPGRAYYLRGLAFELIREWGLAEQEFRRAFKADSTDGDICHALGRSLGEMGRHKDALQFLKRAAVAVPDDPEIANTYGLALLKCNQPDLAARSLERAVELAPDDPQFLSNLGQSYFMSQRIKDAEHILNKALEHAPSFSDAHSTIAQIKWRQGDIISARKHARKAFAANPSNKGVQDLLWALTVDEQK